MHLIRTPLPATPGAAQDFRVFSGRLSDDEEYFYTDDEHGASALVQQTRKDFIVQYYEQLSGNM